MGSSVQFNGVKTVLTAFENYSDADVWAIFCGKDLMFKGEGSSELAQILNALESNGSDAVYRLKVYEGIESAKQIKERTEADGGFSFRLTDEGGALGGLSRSNYIRSLEDRIKKMENGEDDEDDKSIGGKIGSALLGLIEQPNELVQLIGSLKSLFQPQSQPLPYMQPAAIGRAHEFSQPVFTQPAPVVQQPIVNNIPQPENIGDVTKKKNDKPEQGFVEALTDDEKVTRLAAAINKLEIADKNIIVHLEKLAGMSEKNPQLFKLMLAQLDTIE